MKKLIMFLFFFFTVVAFAQTRVAIVGHTSTGEAKIIRTDFSGRLQSDTTEIARLDTLNAEITAIRYMIDQLEAYTDRLEALGDTTNAELTAVRYAVDQLEGYVDGLETNTNNTKLNIDTLRTLVDQLEGYLDNVETNQTTQIASADSIAARLLRLENSSGASSLLAYKGGLVGTAVDSVVFTGTTRYVNINFGIGATNLDTLFISSTSTFTTNTFFAVIGGFSFADALAYISKIYFKASGINKQYQIIAR